MGLKNEPASLNTNTMQNNLFLQRLRIVTLQGKVAYDECFHEGVNIIRGQNSSGKSTIVRFIFFALGGCYSEFVPEAMKCREVLAEVLINGNSLLTLRRKLEVTGDRVNPQAPMYIYIGSMDDSLNPANCDKWKRFGYRTTTQSRSFSNILFSIMGLPEFKADSNITMHQILRLIYLDQESPLSSLFFFEPFDPELTRETVAELLMGLYDERLGKAKLDKIDIEKKIVEVREALKITGSFFEDPLTRSPNFLREQINACTKEIAVITQRVRQLRNDGLESVNPKKRMTLEYERYQLQISTLRADIGKLNYEIQDLETEIQDSKYFIKALQRKLEAINRSIATRNYFDNLHLEYCPECLTKLDDNVPEGHCRLCKSPLDNSRGKAQATRIKLEIEFQVRESRALLEKDQDALMEKKHNLRARRMELSVAQRHYNNAVSNVRSMQEEQIDRLIQDKGYKEGEIVQYRTMLENAEKYEQLESELARLVNRKSGLDQYIYAAMNKIKRDRDVICKFISDNGIYLLRHDQDRQAEFRDVYSFVVDYKQNMAYISDHRIKLSASSSFYLKLTARFALFLASLQVDSMLYPRLMFTDNMEDKGMEEERSKNFQRIVVNRLRELSLTKDPHPAYQLIFATSNIADDLDTPEYTIGEYYTKDNKSLKNVDF